MGISVGSARRAWTVAGLVLGAAALLAAGAVLAGATGVAAMLTGAVAGAGATFAWMRTVGATRAAALAASPGTSDPITGLPDTERLLADLQHAIDGAGTDRVCMLYVFALDGFKDYNDAYGDACGDALLAWLAGKLSAVAGEHGSAYRMRGGSFALLAPGSERFTTSLRDAAVAALHEIGEGFHISCVVGAATLPNEAVASEPALELAVRRAHRQRAERQGKPGLRAPADPTEALRLVRPRYDMAALARRIGRRLRIAPTDIEHLEAAVHLCDVGMLAVPRDVVGRAGKLPGLEWQFILLHTLVGERLLAAGLGMEAVAAVVRSSHERWDGSGYPDGLSGDSIPVGSRVVFVCSAFHDMTSDRPHQPALEPAEALSELEQGAGTQFDPDVVSAFHQEFALMFDRALAS